MADDRLRRRAPRIALAAGLMGAAVWLAAGVLGAQLSAPGLRYLALAVIVVVGAVLYAGLVIGLGGARLSDLRSGVRRG